VLKHHVIDQHPEPGTALKKGRDVRISVSRGPERVIMPNIAGLSQQHAEILLTENGLCRGKMARMSHRRFRRGQIIAQYPLPGKSVLRNTCTDLLISSGPPSSPLPLTDLTQTGFFASSDRTDFLRFTLDNGFLKKRIQVKMELDSFSIELFDDFLSPGREVWLLVPKSGTPTVRVYVDGQVTPLPSMGLKGHNQLLDHGL
jgi:serine/threonine-protein kinase